MSESPNKSKRNRLIMKTLTEISPVDFPADQNATITVHKRGEKEKPMDKTLEGVTKELEAAAASMTDLTKRLADSEAARVKAEAEAAQAKAIAKAAAADDEDPVLKGATPEMAAEIVKLRKESAVAKKALAAMDEERDIAKAAVTISTDLPGIPVKAAVFAPIYKKLAGVLDSDEFAVLNSVLKAGSAAALEVAKALGAGGFGKLARTDAEAEIEKMAHDAAAKNNITFEKAYSQVLELRPDLYARFQQERGASN